MSDAFGDKTPRIIQSWDKMKKVNNIIIMLDRLEDDAADVMKEIDKTLTDEEGRTALINQINTDIITKIHSVKFDLEKLYKSIMR